MELLSRVSTASAQGRRPYQEDRYITVPINAGVAHGQGILLAVFDGHNGFEAAVSASQNIQNFFLTSLIENRGDIISALNTMTAKLAKFLSKEESGTSMSAIYIPENSNTSYLAILGDSPVVWKNKIGSVVLGPEHNARSNFAERQAAISRGASYREGYLWNQQDQGLQLSRALGDKALAFISREAETLEIPLFPGQKILVGSDGLFDPTHDDTFAQAQRLMSMLDAGTSAQDLVEDAISRQTNDNVTALVFSN